MGKFRFRFVLLSLCVGFFTLVAARSALGDHVRFYGDGLAPYVVVHDDGPPTGFAVALMQLMMHSIGEHFAPSDIKVLPWARAVHEVEIAPRSALIVLGQLPERLDRFKWVGPLDELPLGAYARRGAGVRVERLEDLTRYRIGVVRNTSPIQILINALPGIENNFVMLSGIPAQLRMLREGRVDVIVQALGAIDRMMSAEEMVADDYQVVYRFEPLMIYFGFNKDTDEGLIDRLQSALDSFKKVDASGSSPYSRLRERYFSETPPLDAEGAEGK
ncbi:transporter substrate-binding domain-containing protein [Pseudodesulfovibrio indicus]|uniref:substrate-binding periplasmic protein n=1 Tax=Pseudodesulfovibrio indicus TaxID=1716143 RepID=UPI00293036CE|nr:transporter substrate-binding domain-containing protein [Pseudodesulfovibrio indicus]